MFSRQVDCFMSNGEPRFQKENHCHSNRNFDFPVGLRQKQAIPV